MKSYIIYIYFMLGLFTISQTQAQTFHANIFADTFLYFGKKERLQLFFWTNIAKNGDLCKTLPEGKAK